MLTVYQIVLSSDIINYANRNGRGAAEVMFPQYEAMGRLNCFGAKKFGAFDFVHYAPVAKVDTDDLEDCFTIMNRWSDSDEAKVIRLGRVHSLSVGDIVERDGQFFFCDNCGFTEVFIPEFISTVVVK